MSDTPTKRRMSDTPTKRRVTKGASPILSMADRNRVLEENIGLVFHLAKRLGMQPTTPGFDELVSVGLVSFVEHVHRWDPKRAAISTFASLKVRGAMIRHLSTEMRSPMRIPVHAADAEHGFDESAEMPRRVSDARRALRSISLQSGITSADGTVSDIDPVDHRAGLLDVVEQREAIAAVREAIESLPPALAEIIRHAHGIDRERSSLREIAERLNVARETARARLHHAETVLRARLRGLAA